MSSKSLRIRQLAQRTSYLKRHQVTKVTNLVPSSPAKVGDLCFAEYALCASSYGYSKALKSLRKPENDLQSKVIPPRHKRGKRTGKTLRFAGPGSFEVSFTREGFAFLSHKQLLEEKLRISLRCTKPTKSWGPKALLHWKQTLYECLNVLQPTGPEGVSYSLRRLKSSVGYHLRCIRYAMTTFSESEKGHSSRSTSNGRHTYGVFASTWY